MDSTCDYSDTHWQLGEDFLYPHHKNTSRIMILSSRNSLTTFSKVRMALSRFSRKARLLDTLFVQDSSPNVMKIGQTDLCLKPSDRLTDGRMWNPNKWILSYFVKIA